MAREEQMNGGEMTVCELNTLCSLLLFSVTSRMCMCNLAYLGALDIRQRVNNPLLQRWFIYDFGRRGEEARGGPGETETPDKERGEASWLAA